MQTLTLTFLLAHTYIFCDECDDTEAGWRRGSYAARTRRHSVPGVPAGDPAFSSAGGAAIDLPGVPSLSEVIP